MMRLLDQMHLGSYVYSVIRGISGLMIFLLLEFFMAMLSEKVHWIMDFQHPVTKCCFAVGAIISGAAAIRRGEKGKMQHALAGEAAMLCTVAAVGMISFKDGSVISILIDCLLLLFCAFAVAMIRGKQVRKQRGKR